MRLPCKQGPDGERDRRAATGPVKVDVWKGESGAEGCTSNKCVRCDMQGEHRGTRARPEIHWWTQTGTGTEPGMGAAGTGETSTQRHIYIRLRLWLLAIGRELLGQ